MTMLLYLIRHGETEFNKSKKYQGAVDIPLSAEGRSKLFKADFEPETVYVSGLRRTAETAKILFPGARLKRVSGFNEMNFGAFEGRSADEMEKDDAYRKWVSDNCESRCPGGEDKAGFCGRVLAAFEEVIRECAEADRREAVIVSHGGTIMAIAEACGRPGRSFYQWSVGNGAGLVFECDPKRTPLSCEFIRETVYAYS